MQEVKLRSILIYLEEFFDKYEVNIHEMFWDFFTKVGTSGDNNILFWAMSNYGSQSILLPGQLIPSDQSSNQFKS